MSWKQRGHVGAIAAVQAAAPLPHACYSAQLRCTMHGGIRHQHPLGARPLVQLPKRNEVLRQPGQLNSTQCNPAAELLCVLCCVLCGITGG